MHIYFEQKNPQKVEIIYQKRYDYPEVPEFPEHAERENHVQNGFIDEIKMSQGNTSSIASIVSDTTTGPTRLS